MVSPQDDDDSCRVNVTKYEIEKGCNITLCGLNEKYIESLVWEPLKKEFNLNCCHINMTKTYRGCMYNFIRPSDCPGNNK